MTNATSTTPAGSRPWASSSWKGMDYLFSQHDLSFLDDVIPEKDKKKKEDEKKKKKKKGSLDSDNDDVRGFLKFRSKIPKLVKQMWKL